MREIKKIGILNAYDARNRGDRAIVEAHLGFIRKILPDVEVTIFSPHHDYNRTIFESSSCVGPLISAPLGASALWRLISPPIDWLLHIFGWRADHRAKAFHSCDAYFICGGGYLYSSPAPLISRQLWLHVANMLAALQSGKPVLAFPQSWGPIRKSTDRWICRKLASALPTIVTRGRASDLMLSSWGYSEKIVSLPDVVIAASVLIPETADWRLSSRHQGSLGIAPIDWNFDRKVDASGLSDYISKLVTISQTWCSTAGNSVTVFPQVEVEGADDDGIIARKLVAALFAVGVPVSFAEGLGWGEYWTKIAAQEVFIGCRMHSCIFAMVCGVPTIGLGYQPKFTELFEQLGQLDRSHLIEDFDPVKVSTQLENISNEDERIAIARIVDSNAYKVVTTLEQVWQKTVARA
ncbi:MAG: hypothetical protein B9S37_05905 [Verrucomicrobiia bacterium Tous-C3TDCM]|nr:MAG: hypothetical protein B9S37_05905 [Verrucomicrobiae bacterium Tous-C3TDCM]PAZ04460.1 MAG: hypothetical protein CAK88_11405 [Verrucomicrobiae bacterium AMD-G2]